MCGGEKHKANDLTSLLNDAAIEAGADVESPA